MKKQSIVKKSKDFDRIITKRQGKSNKYFIINKETNNENKNLFGITFTKHIGNAVTNNKEIYQKSTTYIIIARKNTLDLTYQQMEQELVNLFLRIKGE